MGAELILMTGVSGFVGFKTLKIALQSGYKVRAIIRKESQAPDNRAALSNPDHLSDVEFVVVPDFAVDNVFEDLMKDVSYVVHIASPMLGGFEDATGALRAAVVATHNLLSAAVKAPGVKHIVITSSITATMEMAEFESGEFSKGFKPDDALKHYHVEAPFPYPIAAYVASKALLLEAAEKFVATEKPHFDIIHILPILILGENPLAKTISELNTNSNGPILNMLLGNLSFPVLASFSHVDDVAKLHLLALNPNIPAGRYLGTVEDPTGGVTDAFAIVRKYFPDAAQKVFVTKPRADFVSMPIEVDTSKTVEAFDFQFQEYEEQVKSLVGNYLSLLSNEWTN